MSQGLPLAEALQGAAAHRGQIPAQSSTMLLTFWEEEGVGFLPGKSAYWFCFLFCSFVHSQQTFLLGSKKKFGVSPSRTILLCGRAAAAQLWASPCSSVYIPSRFPAGTSPSCAVLVINLGFIHPKSPCPLLQLAASPAPGLCTALRISWRGARP